jgi:hypothetical protein
MVVLRATRKVLRALPPSSAGEIPSDSALGDWYVNRVVVDKQPLLLLVSSMSLLAILARARDVRNLPQRLPAMVSERLLRLGIAGSLIDAEVASMHPVHIGPTRDRSVLGFLIEFAKDTTFYLPIPDWNNRTLLEVEDMLARTPWHAGGPTTIFPNLAAPSLLQAKLA